MVELAARSRMALIVEVQSRICGVPLANVIEIMRPLPIEPLSGAPTFVRGIAIIRGIPTPVIDLGAVLGTPHDAAERFITLRASHRQVALSVSAVLGVRELDTKTIQEVPPLLQEAAKDIVEMIGRLDEKVLMVLRAGWELPDEVWQALTAQEAIS